MSSNLGCLDATRRCSVIHKMAPVVIDSQLDARDGAAHAREAIAAKAPRMVIPISAATGAANGFFAKRCIDDHNLRRQCRQREAGACRRGATNRPIVKNEDFAEKARGAAAS